MNETETTKKSKSFFVYMLRCNDDTLYCGITTDIKRRVREHNGEIIGGAKYTMMRRPIEIVYQKKLKDRSLACIEEARIKKLTRAQKEELINREILKK